MKTRRLILAILVWVMALNICKEFPQWSLAWCLFQLVALIGLYGIWFAAKEQFYGKKTKP